MRSLRRKGGLTLVELLVVIVILLILTAVAIPVMAPNVEQKRIRESARMASIFISGAKARAAETGRLVGVQLERLSSNPNASIVLRYIEVPQPYCGDTFDGCSVFYDRSGATPVLKCNLVTFNPDMIKVGSHIRFNGMGWPYEVTGPAASSGSKDISGSIVTIVPTNTAAPEKLWPSSLDGIYDARLYGGVWLDVDPNPGDDPGDSNHDDVRRPLLRQMYEVPQAARPLASTPLQLPDGAAIDISISGEGPGGLFTTSLPANPTDMSLLAVSNTEPIGFLFSKNGAISNVLIGTSSSRVSQSIYLSVGRTDGINTASLPSEKPNCADLQTLWISINTNGHIATSENAKYQGDNKPIEDARAIAIQQQALGGR